MMRGDVEDSIAEMAMISLARFQCDVRPNCSVWHAFLDRNVSYLHYISGTIYAIVVYILFPI